MTNKLLEAAKLAPAIFELRERIAVIMVKELAVRDGQIEGHDRAAEEIILTLCADIADAERLAALNEAAQ